MKYLFKLSVIVWFSTCLIPFVFAQGITDQFLPIYKKFESQVAEIKTLPLERQKEMISIMLPHHHTLISSIENTIGTIECIQTAEPENPELQEEKQSLLDMISNLQALLESILANL